MSNIRVINGRTLYLDLDTFDGRFIGITQYNKSGTVISINEPTFDELDQLEKAIATLKQKIVEESTGYEDIP